jgi:hypothetical protein
MGAKSRILFPGISVRIIFDTFFILLKNLSHPDSIANKYSPYFISTTVPFSAFSASPSNW